MATLKAEQRPTALGLKPRIRNDDDVDSALEEIAFAVELELSVQADLNAAISKLRTKHTDRLNLEIGSSTVTTQERVQVLEAALAEYVAEHPEAAAADGKKSRKFRHGVIGSRQKPARLTYAEGNSASAMIQTLKDGAVDLLAAMFAALSKVILRGTGSDARKADLIFKPTVSPDLKLAETNYRAGKLTDEDLKAFGLIFAPAVDEFYVKPAEYAATRELAAR